MLLSNLSLYFFSPLHSSSGTGTRLFKGRGEPTPGVPSAWQLLLFLLIAEGETCGNSNGCNRERERVELMEGGETVVQERMDTACGERGA